MLLQKSQNLGTRQRLTTTFVWKVSTELNKYRFGSSFAILLWKCVFFLFWFQAPCFPMESIVLTSNLKSHKGKWESYIKCSGFFLFFTHNCSVLKVYAVILQGGSWKNCLHAWSKDLQELADFHRQTKRADFCVEVSNTRWSINGTSNIILGCFKSYIAIT